MLKLLGVWNISHNGCKRKIIKQFAKQHHFAWVIGSDSREYGGRLAYKGMGFVLSWFMFKHLLRGSQICHVAVIAQKSSENLSICPMGWNSTFLNLFSLSLPQIQIIGYRGVVIGKRLERGWKRPSTTAFWYKWIDYFKVWKLFLSLLLENTSVSSITLIPKQRESLPLLGHDCAPSSWNRASTGPNGCGPLQSSHAWAPSFRPGFRFLDNWNSHPDCPAPNSRVCVGLICLLFLFLKQMAKFVCAPPNQVMSRGSCWQGGLGWSMLQGPEYLHHQAKDPPGCKTEPRVGKEGWCVSSILGWKSKGSKSSLFKTDAVKVYFSGHMDRICNLKVSSVCLNFCLAPVSWVTLL